MPRPGFATLFVVGTSVAGTGVAATGCSDDLLPGELVLGTERAAVVVGGEARSELGAAVAAREIDGGVEVLVGAPGTAQVIALAADGTERWRASGGDRFGQQVFATDDGFLVLEPGVGLHQVDQDGAVLWLADATLTGAAVCDDSGIVAVHDMDEAADCGAAELRTACGEDACDVLLDGEVLATTSPGSDVGFVDGVACWGDALLDLDPSPGTVSCADGTVHTGLDGDHLGASLGAGRAAGVFNKWVVPARTRIAPLSGDGEVWAVDAAAERTGVALATAGGITAVGVPGYGATDAREGRVYLVAP